MDTSCWVCGGTTFSYTPVLWNELINDWQLTPIEIDYINRQQGKICENCFSNIRSIALAKAITTSLGFSKLFIDVIKSKNIQRSFSVLEINEAGNLSKYLKLFNNYTFGAYPEVDMHDLPYNDNQFDLIVHSDTLEHVANPVHALSECCRVLKPNGYLCYTIPTVVGRLSRSRVGLKKSFHGNPNDIPDDYSVYTEFGADAWVFLLEAGFDSLSIYSFDYPAGIAYSAKKSSLFKE